MSLLDSIIGRRAEDVSTEVLAHLLSCHDAHVPFQRLFYQRVLDQAASSADLRTEIRTQTTFEVGRPDMVLLTKNALVVLENKLGAYLTSDDQLVRYCEVFENRQVLQEYFRLSPAEVPRRKIVVFLAPTHTLRPSLEASSAVCRHQCQMSFPEWCSEKDIEYRPLPWEQILDYLDLRDSLQEALCDFVAGFTDQRLTEEGRMILKNPEIAVAIRALFQRIDHIRDDLAGDCFKTGRMSQSCNYYGFEIKTASTVCWFGYFLTVWDRYGTPAFLQIKEDWITEEAKDAVKERLERLGFKEDKDHQLLRPFVIDSIDRWTAELRDLLSEISSLTA